MKSIQPSPLLKQALFADALISGAVALLQVGPTAMLAGLLQLPPAVPAGPAVRHATTR